MHIIRKILSSVQSMYVHSSNERFVKYLKNNGVVVGEGTKFRPKSTTIDLTRPSLLTIGANCYFNENFTLLTHDWVTHVFLHAGLDFLPSSGRVTIGNNVATGYNVMILKGVSIGDNVFIGANSLVTKDIPSNCIAAGSPCKVICSLEVFYQKRLIKTELEALDYAKSIKERFGRMPVIDDFWEEFPLFVDGNNVEDNRDFLPVIKSQLGPYYDNYVNNHKAKYDGLDSFLKAAGINVTKYE